MYTERQILQQCDCTFKFPGMLGSPLVESVATANIRLRVPHCSASTHYCAELLIHKSTSMMTLVLSLKCKGLETNLFVQVPFEAIMSLKVVLGCVERPHNLTNMDLQPLLRLQPSELHLTSLQLCRFTALTFLQHCYVLLCCNLL